MKKTTLDTTVYSALSIGAFIVEFLPLSIICITILSYQGIHFFVTVWEETTTTTTKDESLKKISFLFIILMLLVLMMLIFFYRQGLRFQ